MKRSAMMPGIVLGVALGGLGCSTTIQGTAPAKEGFVYAVGSENNVPQAWVCPVSQKGACQKITITETEN